jgi:hypothetical protein
MCVGETTELNKSLSNSQYNSTNHFFPSFVDINLESSTLRTVIFARTFLIKERYSFRLLSKFIIVEFRFKLADDSFISVAHYRCKPARQHLRSFRVIDDDLNQTKYPTPIGNDSKANLNSSKASSGHGTMSSMSVIRLQRRRASHLVLEKWQGDCGL